MRILIYGINYSPEWIGIGKFTADFALWLQQHGHEVKVITALPYYPDWKIQAGYSTWRYTKEKNGDIQIYRCPLYVPKHPHTLTRILHLLSFSISSFPILFWQSYQWRPHLIFTIAPSIFCAPSARLISWLYNTVAWLHIQDFELDAAREMGLLQLSFLNQCGFNLQNWLLRKFHIISSISYKMLDKIEQKGIAKSRIVYFPNWTDGSHIFIGASNNSLRHELQIRDDQPVVLYSGNMGEKQGLEIILSAAQILQHERLLFLLCGQGATEQRLKSQAKNFTNIRFIELQPPDRFNELLNLAWIHLLTQRAEVADWVMPSKLLDILSCGGLVIATAYPHTELGQVVQSSGGILCPPGSATKLSELILQQLAIDYAIQPQQPSAYSAHPIVATHFSSPLVTDNIAENPIRQQRQLASREYVLQNFGREVVLGKILQHIESLKTKH